MAEVVLSHISKKFGSVTAISDVSLTLGNGEFIVLLGPTGAGKTTLLRLVAGLETADAGTISIGGFDATKSAPSSRDVAFVFQQYSLYPHLTVFENLAFPLRSPIRNMTLPRKLKKSQVCCGLKTSCRTALPNYLAVKCNGSQSGVHLSGLPQSI